MICGSGVEMQDFVKMWERSEGTCDDVGKER